MNEFEEFFEWFSGALEQVTSRGESVFSNGHTIDEASWDRKAAYMLYKAVKGEEPPL